MLLFLALVLFCADRARGVAYVTDLCKVTATSDTRAAIERMEFVPFPFRRTSFTDRRAPCAWTTCTDALRQPRLDHFQRAMLAKGVCIPPTSKLALYSVEEARHCLRGRTVHFSGDSYERQLFIAMSDLLTNSTDKREVGTGPARFHEVAKMNDKLRGMPGLQGVQFVCRDQSQCYGIGNDALDNCAECLASMSSKPDARVVGTTIHLFKKDGTYDEKSEREVRQAIQDFLVKVPSVIWTTGPSYSKKDIPAQYREKMPLDKTTQLYLEMTKKKGTLRTTRRWHEDGIPYLDFFEMTHSCHWDNCTTDGGHRARFVNWVKIQMLLSKLCRH